MIFLINSKVFNEVKCFNSKSAFVISMFHRWHLAGSKSSDLFFLRAYGKDFPYKIVQIFCLLVPCVPISHELSGSLSDCFKDRSLVISSTDCFDKSLWRIVIRPKSEVAAINHISDNNIVIYLVVKIYLV